MKKVIVLFVISALCFALMTGCGKNASEEASAGAPNVSTEATSDATAETSDETSKDTSSKDTASESSVEISAEPLEMGTMKSFVGEWKSRTTTYEDHGLDDATYVGYMYLTVDQDGNFSIKDAESENHQEMAGTFSLLGEDKVHMACEGDFFPPQCWEGVEMEQDLTYLFDYVGGNDSLLLTYTDEDGVTSTLFFDRVE